MTIGTERDDTDGKVPPFCTTGAASDAMSPPRVRILSKSEICFSDSSSFWESFSIVEFSVLLRSFCRRSGAESCFFFSCCCRSRRDSQNVLRASTCFW